jgi:ubiquinone/menaquinone biosynthesis C-methylase UbiE
MARRNDDDLLRARSYDDVADAYEHVNAPLMFDAPARSLVECAALAPDERVLDVGTGTGAVARAALGATSSPDRVVAVDPSLPMLMAAQRGLVRHVAAGALPDLPFVDSAFDVVLSAFVMTHVDDPEAAARELHRVLRPGGRVALSAWSPAADDYSAAWTDVVNEFAPSDVIDAAAQRVLPGEARFSQVQGLAGLLEGSAFRSVRTIIRSFTFALTLDEMITTRQACASGRALRALLPDDAWRAFQTRVRDVLGAKFPNGIRYQRDVFFALGAKR